MEIAVHIEALRHEGELMAAATEAAVPDAPVPTCPDWCVRDLVRHMGGVHRWATGYVAEARTEVWDVDLDDVVGTWPDDAALAGWLRDGCATLAGALAAAPPDLECWTFLRAPSPLAMWARRQAHETAIHRVDAELAAGSAVSPFAAPFAADGVDELLTCFVPRRSTRLAGTAEATTLVVRCSDDPLGWTLAIDEEGGVTTGPALADSTDATTGASTGAASGAATLRGRANDLYLALWNRGGANELRVDGDRGVLDRFLDSVHVRWS